MARLEAYIVICVQNRQNNRVSMAKHLLISLDINITYFFILHFLPLHAYPLDKGFRMVSPECHGRILLIDGDHLKLLCVILNLDWVLYLGLCFLQLLVLLV